MQLNMLPPNITRPQDLVTSHEAVCEGFLAQALKKTERANPYIARAHQVWTVLKSLETVHAGAQEESIRNELLAAAGFSDKARSHLSEQELERGIELILATIAKQAEAWREEVVYRYLLTRGDSLGGEMRNVTGALGAAKLSNAIVESLVKSNTAATIERSEGGSEKIQQLRWRDRVLLFDRQPRFVRKNIDLILLSCEGEFRPSMIEEKERFLACGELKAGIDPAGADEHWKTANSALERIRRSFPPGHRPALFFIGAAIELSMAREIFKQLRSDKLSFAANLTVEPQVANLVEWLVGL